MTTYDHDPLFDQRISDWLETDPTRAPEAVLDTVVAAFPSIPQRRASRAPWRFPNMSMPVRVAVLVTVGAILIAGVLAIVGAGGRTPPLPNTPAVVSPSDTSSTPTEALVLDTSFASPRYGYSVDHPGAWTVRPASTSWRADAVTRWGDSTLDAMQGDDARFVAAARPLSKDQTPEDGLKAYCLGDAADTGQCDDVPASWKPTTISGATAYIDLDGVPAAGGTIVPGGKIFDVVAVIGRRLYTFTLDGRVDRPMLDAFLKTVAFRPAEFIDLPPLTTTFTSPTYGYSIGLADDWTTDTASKPWTGFGDDSAQEDGVDITGTDTSVPVASQPLGARTFAEFMKGFHDNTAASVPAGCDGGDPATWPAIRIGDQTGSLEVLCNAASALVEVGGRVYLFQMGNETFDAARHLSVASWKDLLTSVTFDPASAKD